MVYSHKKHQLQCLLVMYGIILLNLAPPLVVYFPYIIYNSGLSWQDIHKLY